MQEISILRILITFIYGAIDDFYQKKGAFFIFSMRCIRISMVHPSWYPLIQGNDRIKIKLPFRRRRRQMRRSKVRSHPSRNQHKSIWLCTCTCRYPSREMIALLIGASLSEPHINGTAVREFYIIIIYYHYGTSVTRNYIPSDALRT